MNTEWTGSLYYNADEIDVGWPWHAYIYEDGLIAGHGLGNTPAEAFADAWDEFWKNS